jgi:hypothetical protein
MNIINNNKEQYELNMYENNTYLSDINTTKKQIFLALNDYKKFFVFHNKNPEYTGYTDSLNDSENKLNDIIKNTQSFNNNLFIKVDELNKKLKEFYIKIEKEKKKKNILTCKYKNLKNDSNGSEEMINDYEDLYKLQYLNNIIFLVGLLLSMVVTKKIFKK